MPRRLHRLRIARQGDDLFVPSNVPHAAVNRGATEPTPTGSFVAMRSEQRMSLQGRYVERAASQTGRSVSG